MFVVMMDRLADEVWLVSLWSIIFVEIVICSDSNEQVEESLGSWKYALERKGNKVSRNETKYCK